ncbi:MAG: cyclic 2,3-diphosphoglycerate synthase [Actinomycetota bacterium]
MGAAGRDFHNFNVAFRDDPSQEVVAFTATQIPYIAGRRYPPELAGPSYPEGIPIVDESELAALVRDREVDEVVFAYSDVSHEHVMHAASTALASGADCRLMGPRSTMLDARVPVVAVCATRTGSGKSQTSRRVAQVLEASGLEVAIVRHPMPYGDLTKQVVQRFASYEDLEAADCTIEEREEYEPHLKEGRVVYAGIDYARILEAAESEADVLLWDGGNNDLPFFRPDLHIVVTDPLRAGNEVRYHPGETNLRMADAVVVNKVDSAEPGQVEAVLESVKRLNPLATVVKAESVVSVESPGEIQGKRVLAIEDGPTLTHGDMSFGAGVVAARRNGASVVVDPRPWATAGLREIYEKYSVGPVLPAMGYSPAQIADLESTINAADADMVLIATPIDLRKLLRIDKPALRVAYELREIGSPNLDEVLAPIIHRANAASPRS